MSIYLCVQHTLNVVYMHALSEGFLWVVRARRACDCTVYELCSIAGRIV